VEVRVAEGRLAVARLIHGGETIDLKGTQTAESGKPLVWRRPAKAAF
jgi:hypothetical protein